MRADKPKGPARRRAAPASNGQTDSEALTVGRNAAKARSRPLNWLWSPWIARAVLTLIVGQPGAGKSSFLAFLMQRARAVLMLPGNEEPFEQMALPRLRAHGVDLANVTVLDGRPWHLRGHLELLVRVAKAHKADLIVLDPVDSYLDEEVNENDGQAVRHQLEAAAALAERSGAAVVATRHPGKDPTNVCPGSRQWRAVPRAILETVEEEGAARRRFLRPYKYSLGDWPQPVAVQLVRDGSAPPVFTVGAAVAAELAALARDVPDRIERSKIETACELLRFLLKEERLEAKEVFGWAERERLSEMTVRRAARLLGVLYDREGFGLDCRCFWRLPPADRQTKGAGGGCVPPPLTTSGRKPGKQGRRPVVVSDTDTHPPPADGKVHTPPPAV